jgi:hypothetical protein
MQNQQHSSILIADDCNYFEGSAVSPSKIISDRSERLYSEPGGVNHFARTTGQAVVVQISGVGPPDTRYFDPANDPESTHKK